jgi:hypothetical protein
MWMDLACASLGRHLRDNVLWVTVTHDEATAQGAQPTVHVRQVLGQEREPGWSGWGCQRRIDDEEGDDWPTPCCFGEGRVIGKAQVPPKPHDDGSHRHRTEKVGGA